MKITKICKFLRFCREAARECRRKKKEYIKCLENRVAVLENRNQTLIDELKSLKELYQQKADWAWNRVVGCPLKINNQSPSTMLRKALFVIASIRDNIRRLMKTNTKQNKTNEESVVNDANTHDWTMDLCTCIRILDKCLCIILYLCTNCDVGEGLWNLLLSALLFFFLFFIIFLFSRRTEESQRFFNLKTKKNTEPTFLIIFQRYWRIFFFFKKKIIAYEIFSQLQFNSLFILIFKSN